MMIREVLRMGDPRAAADVASRSSSSARRSCARCSPDMRDTMAHLNGAGLAAPQIGVGLRVVIFGVDAQPALSRRRGGARHRAHQPDARAARATRSRRAGKAACRCPACAAWCRATRSCATRGFDDERQADRARRRRLPRARGAARVRPPRRHPLPDAHPRPDAVRLQRSAVSQEQDAAARKTERRASSSCSSCSTVFGVRRAPRPSTRNTSSTRSPSVLICAVCRLMWWRASMRAMRVQQARAGRSPRSTAA